MPPRRTSAEKLASELIGICNERGLKQLMRDQQRVLSGPLDYCEERKRASEEYLINS